MRVEVFQCCVARQKDDVIPMHLNTPPGIRLHTPVEMLSRTASSNSLRSLSSEDEALYLQKALCQNYEQKERKSKGIIITPTTPPEPVEPIDKNDDIPLKPDPILIQAPIPTDISFDITEKYSNMNKNVSFESTTITSVGSDTNALSSLGERDSSWDELSKTTEKRTMTNHNTSLGERDSSWDELSKTTDGKRTISPTEERASTRSLTESPELKERITPTTAATIEGPLLPDEEVDSYDTDRDRPKQIVQCVSASQL